MRNSNHPALPVAPCIASNSLRRFPAWPDWSPKMPFCTCSFTNIMAWCTGQPGHGTDVDWFKQRKTNTMLGHYWCPSMLSSSPIFQDIPRYSKIFHWSILILNALHWSHMIPPLEQWSCWGSHPKYLRVQFVDCAQWHLPGHSRLSCTAPR